MSLRHARREAFLPDPAPPLPESVPAATPPPLCEILSEREEEIARLAARGLSNKEIGQYLGISPWTVATHLRRLFLKLEITRRIELCAIIVHASVSQDDIRRMVSPIRARH